MVTSTPFFLKMPASLASVSGANPVQPLMPMVSDVAAIAGADNPTAAVRAAAKMVVLFILVPLFCLVRRNCLTEPKRLVNEAGSVMDHGLTQRPGGPRKPCTPDQLRSLAWFNRLQ